ncbi:(d)CMP kinase [Buchnera aphidicola]|uniref:(d)CMP kinase n=1 Tax=Buchnera aphidicola TaxID=9 RepID=UPI0034638E3F
MQLPPVITIDGPSGSGKSTLSKSLANYLKWYTLESGMIYRIFACLLLKKKFFFEKKKIIHVLKDLEKYFIYENGMICNIINKNFSYRYIVSKEVTHLSSKIAKNAYIREKLLLKQRLFRRYPGLVADGRDMGTMVFPDAKIKFFLKADLKNRVYRRMQEFQNQGIKSDFKTTLLHMKKRDERDKNRKNSPLVPANNAIILDSSNMNITEVIQYTINCINKILI